MLTGTRRAQNFCRGLKMLSLASDCKIPLTINLLMADCNILPPEHYVFLYHHEIYGKINMAHKLLDIDCRAASCLYPAIIIIREGLTGCRG